MSQGSTSTNIISQNNAIHSIQIFYQSHNHNTIHEVYAHKFYNADTFHIMFTHIFLNFLPREHTRRATIECTGGAIQFYTSLWPNTFNQTKIYMHPALA